ncbi:MAG: SH3 domain-containing protein [Thiotrichales bacterium]|nr:SH3 domain-containing protein [Thiotrichales bacterium]
MQKLLTTRLYFFTIILFIFLVSMSHAESGDELVITAYIVNLRSGPSIETEALAKLALGRKLIELQRNGEWIEVETNRQDISTGWVHQSLVAKADEVSEELVKKKQANKTTRFQVFKQRFEELNKNIEQQNGVIYFSAVREQGKGNVDVIATAEWLQAERELKQNTLSEIFKLWTDVNPIGRSISMKVYDEKDEQHMVMLR